MKRRLLPLLAGLLAVSACYMPLFDEALSAAYASARKMRHDATIGPYKMWEGDFSRYNEVRFLPKKMSNPDGGFVLRLRDGEYRIGYTQWNFGNWSQTETMINSPYAANVFNLAASVVPGNLPMEGYLAYFINDEPNPSFNNLRRANLGSIIPAGGAFDRNVVTDLQADLPGSTPTIISGHYLPDTAPNNELFQVFAYDSTAPGYIEMQYRIDSQFLTSTSVANLVLARFPFTIMPAANMPFPVQPPASGFYFYSPATGRSYFSTYVSNHWISYCWYHDAGLRFKQLPLKNRISAALSSGELYVENGASGEVYDPDGQPKFIFPIGSMRFAHERYENGAYRMVFVQRLMFYDNKDGGDQGQWEVYSIPTAELRNLD